MIDFFNLIQINSVLLLLLITCGTLYVYYHILAEYSKMAATGIITKQAVSTLILLYIGVFISSIDIILLMIYITKGS